MSTEGNTSEVSLRVVSAGFLLASAALAVTTISFANNTVDAPIVLIAMATAGFAAVSLTALYASFAVTQKAHSEGNAPGWLFIAIPGGFVLNSQICGLGFGACSVICGAINLGLIGLAALTAYRLRTGGNVTPHIAAMIAVGLLPHCLCNMNANVLWLTSLGASPACELPGLLTALFAIAAIKGVLPRGSRMMTAVMLLMIVGTTVGAHGFGFPWQSCAEIPHHHAL